uniref:Uncharacterized protein n=1 Tax=Oryza glumipatula TaxID=40148 RepID=A0A0D9Y5U1_9ORYZ
MDFIGSGGGEELGLGQQWRVESGRRRGERGVTAPISVEGVGEESGDVERHGPTGERRWTRRKCGGCLRFVVATGFRRVSWPKNGVQQRSRRWERRGNGTRSELTGESRDGERHGEHGRGRGELKQLGKMREGCAGMDFIGSGGGEELGDPSWSQPPATSGWRRQMRWLP